MHIYILYIRKVCNCYKLICHDRCSQYAKRTIFDLLLPRLLADDPITAEDIARLGEGGLCLGCAECHWPNCGFGHC